MANSDSSSSMIITKYNVAYCLHYDIFKKINNFRRTGLLFCIYYYKARYQKRNCKIFHQFCSQEEKSISKGSVCVRLSFQNKIRKSKGKLINCYKKCPHKNEPFLLFPDYYKLGTNRSCVFLWKRNTIRLFIFFFFFLNNNFSILIKNFY